MLTYTYEKLNVLKTCPLRVYVKIPVNVNIVCIYTPDPIYFGSFIHIFDAILYLLGEFQNSNIFLII